MTLVPFSVNLTIMSFSDNLATQCAFLKPQAAISPATGPLHSLFSLPFLL